MSLQTELLSGALSVVLRNERSEISISHDVHRSSSAQSSFAQRNGEDYIENEDESGQLTCSVVSLGNENVYCSPDFTYGVTLLQCCL